MIAAKQSSLRSCCYLLTLNSRPPHPPQAAAEAKAAEELAVRTTPVPPGARLMMAVMAVLYVLYAYRIDAVSAPELQ